MPLDNLIAVGLPIALGAVMIGAGLVNFAGPGSVRHAFARWGYPAGFHRVTGGLEATAGLLLVPATSRAGAAGSFVILLAAVMTLIRHRDWTHLPGAVVLTAAAAVAVAVAIRG